MSATHIAPNERPCVECGRPVTYSSAAEAALAGEPMHACCVSRREAERADARVAAASNIGDALDHIEAAHLAGVDFAAMLEVQSIRFGR